MIKTAHLPRILVTPGEPAGIGPDITLALAKQTRPAEIVVVADPDSLSERAALLNESVNLVACDLNKAPSTTPIGTLKYVAVKRAAKTTAGVIDIKNSAYVLSTLQKASELCLQKKAQAIVTGPVQKSALNQAGIDFSGHTEFFARAADVKETLMVFVATVNNDIPPLIVALATTHLPLKDVPAKLTTEKLRNCILILHSGLQKLFNIEKPRILVCGLNPHAGEDGYLGREEIDVITPVINELRKLHYDVKGPFSADSIFLPHQRVQGDAILALYHDQALPVVKYASFGHAVNVTFGLPFIRTSVDHGTALTLAGTDKADPSSLFAAVELAIKLAS